MMKSLTRVLLVLSACLCTSVALAQSETTFTYQGQLNQTGQPANGNFTLTFSLWNSLASGAQIGGDVVISPVTVVDGIFTVSLDFGAAPFNGQNRWLEIEVNGQVLAPRQLISHSPYSIQTRGIFVNDAGRVGIGTTSPAADLEVDGTVSDETGLLIRAPGGATGQVAVSSPGGEPGIIGVANNGNRRDIRFSDEGIELLTNSTPTIPSSINGLSIFQDGSVEIGGVSPSNTKLYVKQTSSTGPIARIAIHGESDSGLIGGVGVFGEAIGSDGVGVQGKADTASAGTGVEGSGNYRGVSGHSTTAGGYAGYFTGGLNYFQGNVGINVLAPDYQLDVNGEVRMQGLPTGTNVAVHISSTGRLVRATSSRRYKDHIEPLDLSSQSEALFQLQPVSYDYRESGQHDIGLIAEEVAELIPELVTYDQEGRPEAVKYDKGFLYLLDVARRQQQELERRDRLIEGMMRRLDALERQSS